MLKLPEAACPSRSRQRASRNRSVTPLKSAQVVASIDEAIARSMCVEKDLFRNSGAGILDTFLLHAVDHAGTIVG